MYYNRLTITGVVAGLFINKKPFDGWGVKKITGVETNDIWILQVSLNFVNKHQTK